MEPLPFPTPPRAVVFEIIKRKSYGEKRIVLASGRRATFDMKPTMFYSEALALLPELVLERLKGVDFDCIAGWRRGSAHLAGDVARQDPAWPRHSRLLRPS